jgi:hypothetical protein
METIRIAILEEDGLTTGELIKGEPEIGQVVTIKSSDSNGMPFTLTGALAEIL